MSGATKGCLIALGVLVALGVLLSVLFVLFIGRAAEELDETIDDNLGEADPDDYDIEPTDCRVESGGVAVMEGELTNTSDRTRGFSIQASFTTEELRIGSSSTTIGDLREGETAVWRVTSFDIVPADVEPADVTCTVETVEYWF